jgi:hypothetical protein
MAFVGSRSTTMQRYAKSGVVVGDLMDVGYRAAYAVAKDNLRHCLIGCAHLKGEIEV